MVIHTTSLFFSVEEYEAVEQGWVGICLSGFKTAQEHGLLIPSGLNGCSQCETGQWRFFFFSKVESAEASRSNHLSSPPARDLARLRKKSITLRAAPELPEWCERSRSYS